MATVTPKVRLGLRNVHYAVMTGITSGVPTYSKPTKLSGAVKFSASTEGDNTTFYADDGPYFEDPNNDGYTGEYESALFQENFLEQVLGQLRSSNNLLFEFADAEIAPVAIIAEFATNATAKRICFYNVLCGRPNVDAQTREKNKTPQTEKVSLKMRPLEFYDKYRIVKFVSTPETDLDTYDKFFESVYIPKEEEIKTMISKRAAMFAPQGNAIPMDNAATHAAATSVTAKLDGTVTATAHSASMEDTVEKSGK